MGRPCEKMCGEVLPLVPVGASNAMPSRLIWQRFGIWAHATIAHALNNLTAAGTIMRRAEPTATGARHLYWREQV